MERSRDRAGNVQMSNGELTRPTAPTSAWSKQEDFRYEASRGIQQSGGRKQRCWREWKHGVFEKMGQQRLADAYQEPTIFATKWPLLAAKSPNTSTQIQSLQAVWRSEYRCAESPKAARAVFDRSHDYDRCLLMNKASAWKTKTTD